ncbi:MAG: VWA domain-containing protein, partial [bacterium]
MSDLRKFQNVSLVIGTLVLAAFTSPAHAINLEITNVNYDNFPGIHVFCRVTDDSGEYVEDLGSGNFELRENGVLVNEAVEAQYGYMAASLVMDASGSMGGFEQDVIDACSYFVNEMDDLDKGAIIRFSTTASVQVPMTYDKNALLAAIASYSTSGLTDLWDAIALGINECFFEPEKKVVVAFTDGQDNQPGISAGELPGLAGQDITIYTIGIGNQLEDSLIYVAEQTGGFFLSIETPSQMQEVLEDIRWDIGNLYDLFYTSPNPNPDGSRRRLEVVCTYQGYADWDTTEYTAPASVPPSIVLSTATQQLLGV